ncbi:hypothetical protein ZHAS_00012638 [Anopheles sinensis]|uniref:Uncharacterized protein n=1 Tax=Anopheles sinensis TaxID=74873 RepID=A0A084W3E6_ANOSI|nr:hypothetical protein ZHAS_00012638 [Anopheles sinensis]
MAAILMPRRQMLWDLRRKVDLSLLSLPSMLPGAAKHKTETYSLEAGPRNLESTRLTQPSVPARNDKLALAGHLAA